MFRFLLFASVVALATSEHWFVQDAANMTCLIVDAEPIIHVTFKDENGTTFTHTVALNKTNSVNGECAFVHQNQSTQSLSVRFFPDGKPGTATQAQEWILDLIFGKDQKDESVEFKLIDYKLTTAPGWLNGSVTEVFNKADDAELDVVGHKLSAFKCSTSNLVMQNSTSVEMKNLKAIAFAQLNTTDFPQGQDFEQCFLDSRTSDIVPIIVGACLAGLVVIVLVAYLIGRARAKRQGYASV